jgi:hypothetical protein
MLYWYWVHLTHPAQCLDYPSERNFASSHQIMPRTFSDLFLVSSEHLIAKVAEHAIGGIGRIKSIERGT